MKFWLVMVVTPVLAACTFLPGPGQDQATVTYTLAWPEALAEISLPQMGATVVVTQPTAAPGFDTAQMAYVEQAFRLDYYAYHRWTDTPARMLEPLLVRALQHSGLFRAVVAAPAPVDSEFRLDSEVLKLQQVVNGDASSVQFSLRVDLFDMSERRLVASQIFEAQVAARQANPYAGAVAANEAVAQVLTKLVRFLGEQVARVETRGAGMAGDAKLAVERNA